MLTPLDQKIDPLADLDKSDWTNLRDWECALPRYLCGVERVRLLNCRCLCSNFSEQIYPLRVSASSESVTTFWLTIPMYLQ